MEFLKNSCNFAVNFIVLLLRFIHNFDIEKKISAKHENLKKKLEKNWKEFTEDIVFLLSLIHAISWWLYSI